MTIPASLNLSQMRRNTSPWTLPSPLSGSAIQIRSSWFTLLSPNSVIQQTGAGDLSTRGDSAAASSIGVQQAEHGLQVDQRLLDLAVDRAEEVQRHGELQQIGIHHDEVAHGHGAGHHALRRQDHRSEEHTSELQSLMRI